MLLTGSGFATAINFGYNVAVAQFLGPTGYGQAAAVYTILILVSAVTLSFQIVSAKVVAQQEFPEGQRAVYRGLHQGSWVCGILIAVGLLAFQAPIAKYLHLPGSILIVLLAAGVAFYIPMGTRRGYLQGIYGFRRLAANLVLEGIVRLGGSLLLIVLGLGVPGVIGANAAAVAIAYFAIEPKRVRVIPNPLHMIQAVREIRQAMVFFSGQVLISNCDIILVKHFFAPTPAGVYAAVAMVGRVIFSFSSAVVNSMFPLVAGTREEERRDLKVIATSLVLVLGIGAVITLGLGLAPAGLWTAFFGSGFVIGGEYSLSYLLALYAITTVIYSLSVVIITYEMSYTIANTSWVQLAFSGVVIAGICLFHSSLRQVILVQLILMIVLLILVAIPFLIGQLRELREPEEPSEAGESRSLRLIRRVTGDEVIAAFLRADFPNPAFQNYREVMRDIVANPDLDSADENAKRRALLFVRHLALWKEIPSETEWYEAEIREGDLGRIRVFPRAQWRKIARGDFSILTVAERLRSDTGGGDGFLRAKIASLRAKFLNGEAPSSAVLLIGVGQSGPLTILDGNHRMVAAVLESPDMLRRFRFLCGLSPRMEECCWYNTNLVTLFRYGRNVLRNATYDPKAELAGLLRSVNSLARE